MLCKYCNEDYPDNNFPVALTTSTKVYRRKKCQKCYCATKRQRHKTIKKTIDAYKQERGCHNCGFKDYRALEFHHHNNDKTFNVADGLKRQLSLNVLMEEILRCQVICANCHRIEHYT